MEIYAAMIDRMDQNIGRLLAKLEELGEDENTLIMFVSDNGASSENVNIQDDYGELGTLTRWSSLQGNWANVSNTPFRMFKNYSYEGGINTPFIAYWPKKIKPNTVSRFPGHFIDVMSTLVEISDASYPDTFNRQTITPMQGESLLPVFKGENSSRETPLFWEWRRGQAVYSNGYKIVKEGKDKPFELYKVDEDPTETNNLATSQADKVKELKALFDKWKASLPDYSK